MSRPLSILRHQGHLEPASTRPGFTSTVINTVLTLRCAPSASLHRPPAPRHWHRLLETRQRAGCWGSCTLTLGSGQGQPWWRPETEPCERWLLTVPWDWVWGFGKSSLSGRAPRPPVSLYEPLLPPPGKQHPEFWAGRFGLGPPGPAGTELPACPTLLAGSRDVRGVALARDKWCPGSCSHSAIRKPQGLCPHPTCYRSPGLTSHS